MKKRIIMTLAAIVMAGTLMGADFECDANSDCEVFCD